MMMPCGLPDDFKRAVGLSLPYKFLHGVAEDRELPAGLEAAEAFWGYHHTSGGPPQRQLGVDQHVASKQIFTKFGARTELAGRMNVPISVALKLRFVSRIADINERIADEAVCGY